MNNASILYNTRNKATKAHSSAIQPWIRRLNHAFCNGTTEGKEEAEARAIATREWLQQGTFALRWLVITVRKEKWYKER